MKSTLTFQPMMLDFPNKILPGFELFEKVLNKIAHSMKFCHSISHNFHSISRIFNFSFYFTEKIFKTENYGTLLRLITQPFKINKVDLRHATKFEALCERLRFEKVKKLKK